jgi:hypothetical protein
VADLVLDNLRQLVESVRAHEHVDWEFDDDMGKKLKGFRCTVCKQAFQAPLDSRFRLPPYYGHVFSSLKETEKFLESLKEARVPKEPPPAVAIPKEQNFFCHKMFIPLYYTVPAAIAVVALTVAIFTLAHSVRKARA